MSLCHNNNKASPVSSPSGLILKWWKYPDYVFAFWVLACFVFFLLLTLCLFLLIDWSVLVCFGCCIVFCDISSSYIPILLKCSCWFSKARQSMSSYRLSSVCHLFPLDISFLRYLLLILGGPRMSHHPSDYDSGLHHPCIVASALCHCLFPSPSWFHISMALCLLTVLLQLILYVEKEYFVNINIFNCLGLSVY